MKISLNLVARAAELVEINPRRMFGVVTASERDRCPIWYPTPETAKGGASRADFTAALAEAADKIYWAYGVSPILTLEQLTPVPASFRQGVPTVWKLDVRFAHWVADDVRFVYFGDVPLELYDPDLDGYPEFVRFQLDPVPEPPTTFVCCVPDTYRTDGSTGFSIEWCVGGYPNWLTSPVPIPSYLCANPALYINQSEPIDGDQPTSYIDSLSIYGVEVSGKYDVIAGRFLPLYSTACNQQLYVMHGDTRAEPSWAKLAMTLMEVDVCDCDFVRSRVERWRETPFTERGLRAIPAPSAYWNPFGVPKQGAIEARLEVEQLWLR